MDDCKEFKNRERIAKQIAKTNDSIRKKYCALKIGKNGGRCRVGETF